MIKKVSLQEFVLIYFFIIIVSQSCRTFIDEKNKVISIGKISTESTYMKNGNVKIVYHFKGKKYRDVASFDAKQFGYGNMFLIYIDKTDPFTYIIPEPKVKVFNLKDFVVKCNECKTDTIDFRLTEAID